MCMYGEGIRFEMDSMKINDRSVRPLAFGFDKGRTSRLELVLSPRPHLASHRYNNTEARSHSLVRVSARRCNSMRDTWKWKTIRAHPSLVFLDYPISSITVGAELDLLRIQLRSCASLTASLFSIFPLRGHSTCRPGERARLLLFHVSLAFIIIILLIPLNWEQQKVRKELSWTNTYR